MAISPEAMTNEELENAIMFSTMAVNRGLPTQEERRAMAERHIALTEERTRRNK